MSTCKFRKLNDKMHIHSHSVMNQKQAKKESIQSIYITKKVYIKEYMYISKILQQKLFQEKKSKEKNLDIAHACQECNILKGMVRFEL